MITITQTVNTFMPLSQALMKEYRRLSLIFLKEYGTGLCHDLARQSTPLKTMGGNANAAYAKFIVDHQKRVSLAFKPIQSRTFGQYLLNQDWQSADAYGFKSTSPKIQKLVATKQWSTILYVFMKHYGGITPDGLGRQEVYDNADLALLYKWTTERGNKKGGKKGGKKGNPYYIRNRQTIQSVRSATPSAKVGFMVGGWLIAANMLGNKPDPSTRRVQQAIWMQGKGSGEARVSENPEGTSAVISNDYANIGNYMSNSFVEQALNDRWKKMEKGFPVIFWQAAKNVGWEPDMF